MRFTAILLLAACLQVSAIGFSQKITISKKDVSLEKVIEEIKRQTGYNFVYTNNVLKKAVNVSVDVKNAVIDDVLKICFKEQPFTYAIIDNIVVVSPKDESFESLYAALPPRKTVKGRIIDKKGAPIAGVSILVKGTQIGAQTDANGEFSLTTLKSEPILIITFIGFEKQEVNAKSGNVTIVMQEASVILENAVVTYSTGYQNISKERATGSFDVVGQDVLSKRPVSNISTALQGLVAGMQGKENADGSVNFLIRGTGSFYAETKPLVVVDGFPVANIDFSTINPNDVESVTVLKDAAAASIWGARSANGVIVITTKKAKAGKTTIQGRVFTRISDMVDLDQLLVQANSADHVRYEKMAWDNNWVLSPYAGTLQQISSSLTLAQEYLWKKKIGTITDAQLTAGLDSLSKINNREQVKDNLLQRAILSQYNVSFSGGTDRSKSYASLMYEKNKDGYTKNKYDRFMLNFTNEYQLAKFLTFNIGAVVQYKKQENSGATVSEMQGISPYETLLNPDGKYSVNLKLNREQLATLPLDKFPYPDWSYNLLREVRGRKLTREDLSGRIQTGLNVKILKGLTFDARFQYERVRTDYENYYSEETYEARNAVNNMAKYNQALRRVDTTYIPKGGILKTNQAITEGYVIRNQFNFDRNFGRRHNITAIAGMELSQTTVTAKTNPWAYGYFPEKLQTSVPQFGYGSSVDQLKNFLNNTATISGSNTVLEWTRDKFVSFYGNASYTYDNKYTISGSARSDASNYITDDPSLRWSPLWSVGAMWNISREDFMASLPFIDRLSARFTYGRNGNAEKTTSTKTLVTLSSAISATTGTITGTISDYGNPKLRWEKTTTTDLGFDFSMFRNKLVGKIDFYNKQGSDITGMVTLPAATGTTSQKFNNAKIVNKGFELQLGTNINITRNISYNPVVTYAYNYNKITDLYYPNLYAYALLDGTFVQGRPIGALYSYTYRGMVNGTPNVTGLNKGLQNFNDVALHNRALGLPFLNYEGTTIPPHTLGWINNVNVYNFYVTALFVGKLGGVYRNPVFNYATTVGSSKTYVNSLVSQVFAGDTSIPGFSLPNNTQTYLWDRYAPNLNTLVESSSYIECKEVSIGYNLPEKFIGKAGFSSAKIYVQARNLGIVWRANDKGYNPDWLPGTYRPAGTFTIGANVQF